MPGITGVYALPSSVLQETFYGALKHRVPNLENRGQGGFGLAAFQLSLREEKHKNRQRKWRFCPPSATFAKITIYYGENQHI
jgi:hypothetical protein